MDQADFWGFLERSGAATNYPAERLAWLEHRLGKIGLEHVVDFQERFEAARRPIDTYAMLCAAELIVGGALSDDSFWYFQPWLIGQGRRWWEHAAREPDNLADLPAVQALAGRPAAEWRADEWPQFEELAYVARYVYAERTGAEDGLVDVLAARGIVTYERPALADRSWRADRFTGLPRLAALFPDHARQS